MSAYFINHRNMSHNLVILTCKLPRNETTLISLSATFSNNISKTESVTKMSKLNYLHHGNPHSNEALVDLLTTIGNEIIPETLKKLKFLLRGHVDKAVLDHVETGPQLFQILHERRLVTNGRLAFLRKLLSDIRCVRLVSYLDGYKDKKRTEVWADEGFIEMSSRQSCKERRLKGLIGRIENEITLYVDNEEKLKEDIKEITREIEGNKQKIITHEECILKTKAIQKKEQLNLQSVEKMLEDIKYLIRKLYREEESLSDKLKSTRKQRKPIQNDLIAKHAEIKGQQLMEGELLRKYEKISEHIRLSFKDLRDQTTEMLAVENKMQDDTSQIRKLKKEITMHALASKQLKETSKAIKQELEEFTSTASYSPDFVNMSARDLEQYLATPDVLAQRMHDSAFKIVDYNGLIERTAKPLVIGCKGSKSDPPNFRFPCSIAIDHHDNIYIADSRNQRVQVLYLDGSPARKPLEVGNFQPCTIAVSSTSGKIFTSNSHLVRVYSSVGEPLCYILPIYGKTDVRPNITSLAITNDDALLLVDKVNQRIEKFRQDGTFLGFIGGNHVFESPFGIAVAKNGDIVISESDTHCIKIFEGENGPLKRVCGTKGIGKEKFLYPRGIAADKNNIFVADSGNHQIQVINTKGEEDASFGSLGNMPGFFDTPYDVALTNDGEKVVVVEARNHRLQVFTKAVSDADSFTDSRPDTPRNDYSDDVKE